MNMTATMTTTTTMSCHRFLGKKNYFTTSLPVGPSASPFFFFHANTIQTTTTTNNNQESFLMGANVWDPVHDDA